ncbi:MAG: hypothetical protein AAFV45_04415 [Pseudomonadota bacterium]
MPGPYSVLIFGASYGSLLATKLAMAGHAVKLLCLSAEAEKINADGVIVRMPVRGRDALVEIHSKSLSGSITAGGTKDVTPDNFDLIALAMQEPQYRAPGVRELLAKIAQSGKPCMSIMNMPPLPFMKRIPGIDPETIQKCYADATVWDGFDPANMTLCSPDPQAFRPPDDPPNVLQVSLPTNFKAASFEDAASTQMLRDMQAGIEQARFTMDGEDIEVPVKLKVHNSVFVPLAKWAMLLTGNYRCIQLDGMRSIRDAVHTDLAKSKDVYDWVRALCMSIGAAENDLVPFEKYAAAGEGLIKPSSAARALEAGAQNIERVDLLVKTIADGRGLSHPSVDETVAAVEHWLSKNRQGAAA